jgi:Ca2+-binding EF-hand superfamily protein/thiol-disulfide isomerase/thioredoxin
MMQRESTSSAAVCFLHRLSPFLRLVFAAVVITIVPAGVAQAQKTGPGGGRTPQDAPDKSIWDEWEERLVRRFYSVWPDPPESVAMLADILRGSQLGPGEGWFKKAVTQTRYDWSATCERLDRNKDGQIARNEFAGCDADFARLDRDHDGSLSKRDFDFSAHALAPSPGAMLFYLADRDGNGKLTEQELSSFFRSADSGGEGFLSLADLQDAVAPPPRARGAAGGSRGPSKITLLKGLFRQEIGSLQAGPVLGSAAPDFTLKTVDGRQEITLSKLVGPKPVVLVFGNFTCGPFRSQAGNVEKLYRRYRERATFLMVYVREAHPIDGWQLESNNRVGVALRQPRSYDERVKVAQTCSSSLGLGMPMLVDTIGDQVGACYSAMPSRLYLIDQRGRVAFKNGRGPFGFKPAELEHALLLLLQDEFPDLKGKSSGSSEASPVERPENNRGATQRNPASAGFVVSPAQLP